MEATTLKQKKNELIKNIGALLEDFSKDVGPCKMNIVADVYESGPTGFKQAITIKITI